MKNHIGYLEFTALKRLLNACAGQKKKFPTKNTRFHTVFVGGADFRAVNLPEFVGLEAGL
ncbi:hypothetical protein ACM1ZW_20910 [Pseudomonas sp. NFX71]|uniref:hypothetical protein n=1 Tax=Pseudomonas sp. NFX71 TaxID=3399121 RepID=UPI003A89B849